MRPNDTYDHFATEFSYPIDREDVIAAIGETTIQSPNGTSESIASVLERTDATTFRSANELYGTFFAHLGDQYVGRKFYDDRGTNFGSGDAPTI